MTDFIRAKHCTFDDKTAHNNYAFRLSVARQEGKMSEEILSN